MSPVEMVLASTSTYRAELLQRLQIPFSQLNPDYKEVPEPTESPMATALRHATGKATSLLRDTMTDRTVICGSDQVAVCANQVLHKPGAKSRAVEQLLQCSGQWVEFHTAIALIRPGTGTFAAGESYRVKFRELRASEVETYVSLDNPIYSAGSIKAESLGVSLLEHGEGRDVTTLYGLPLMLLCDGLLELNLTLADFRE